MSCWTPQSGPQADAISATWCPELFFGGARGGGKSDFLLGDFLQDVPKFGRHWQGILIRRTYPELQELTQRSTVLFPQTGAVWYEQPKEWHWPNGACLRLRYLERTVDYTRYQGHQFTWIGWDEITQHPTLDPYHALRACLRWAEAEVPTKRIRASGNPGGPGHHAVKTYFIDPAPGGYSPIDDKTTEMTRMFIPSRVVDNKILLERDPGYIARLRGSGSAELVRAWLDGDWNVVQGAFFDTFGAKHLIRPFAIPEHWTRFCAYDHGYARPFSVGWYAIADGTEGGLPKGSVVRYREWYGAAGPNTGLRLQAEAIAQGIKAKEGKEQIVYRVADPSIFKAEGGPRIAELFARHGVTFRPADNQRPAGWAQCRARLSGLDGRPMFYVFDTCPDFIRLVPLQQHDPSKPEDLDSEGEDHVVDEWRYGMMSRPFQAPAPAPKEIKGLESLTMNDLWKNTKKNHDSRY